MSETIVAISTALGEAGIGIVRISGPASKDIMRLIMEKCPLDIIPRHAYLSKIIGNNSEIIDEGIFLFMKAPFSYTGEDMLEIQAHGSNISLKKILSTVINYKNYNIRLAEPGEFTKLSFLNGKMDLSQAEAVIDIIKAKSDLSLEFANKQHQGRMSDEIKIIRDILLNILAQMTVNIDYPDEDIIDTERNELIRQISATLLKIDRLIETSNIGKIAREGIHTAIVGKPNVGKSSLMNALLGEGRVIVTDIPGTTRDTVEEIINIDGSPIVLTDTAGMRESNNEVEKIGIEKSEQAVLTSDMLLLVLDGSKDLDEDDNIIFNKIEKSGNNNILVIINKSDLGIKIDKKIIKDRFVNCAIIETSLIGDGPLNAAKDISFAIKKMFELENIKNSESSIVTNERHLKLLMDSKSDILDAINLLKLNEPLEVAELSVRYAYEKLGNIIGEAVGDEVLDTVFSKFCLGK